MSLSKSERTRALRYKRPALASMGYDFMIREMWDIEEACADVQWYVDTDEDTLINALDGDDEEAFEFKMAFSDLSAKAEQLMEQIQENVDDGDEFDDCTVALVGNRYNVLGYDGDEEDYFSLTSYEEGLAMTEAGKRLMRKTKAEMIATVGQCLGIVMCYLDLRQSYDYLKATMDILRDENTSVLKTIKAINDAYDAAAEDNFMDWRDGARHFNLLLSELPERMWLE